MRCSTRAAGCWCSRVTAPRGSQAVLGPCCGTCSSAFLAKQLHPGDVLIGNDPWHGSGHHVDIFVATPAFLADKVIGFAVSAAHHVDIGGRRATTESRDNYEEGLRIPVCKIFKGGEPNEDVFAFIASNVRMSDTVIGDLRAQFAANHVGCERLAEICVQRGWPNLAGSRGRDHHAVRRRSRVPRSRQSRTASMSTRRRSASSTGRSFAFAQPVTVTGDQITVDFSGSSPQVGPRSTAP